MNSAEINTRVDRVRGYVEVVEREAAKAISKEVKERREEDVNVVFEEKCVGRASEANEAVRTPAGATTMLIGVASRSDALFL